MKFNYNNPKYLFLAILAWVFAFDQYTHSASHFYDSLHRLTRSVNNDGTVTEYSYDSAGNRLSKTVTLAPPAITAGPQDQTAVAGDTASFSVGATGSAPLTYRWKFNGTDIPDGTEWGYYLSDVAHTDAGNYTVVVSNNAGSITSEVAVLEVLLPFDYWTTVQFTEEELADPAISGPEAIPLADGVPNLLKFLHNIEPTVPLTAEDRAALPKLGFEIVDDVKYLTLTYRDNALATEITVEVQASTSLLPDSWETITPDVSEYLPEPDPTTGDPIRRVKVDVTGKSRSFIRLKVNISDI